MGVARIWVAIVIGALCVLKPLLAGDGPVLALLPGLGI